jgi:hypothetical protein
MSLKEIANYSIQEKRQLFLVLIKDPAIKPFITEYVHEKITALIPEVTKRLDRIEAEIKNKKTEGKL